MNMIDERCENCPRVKSIVWLAHELTEYQPPGSRDSDIVWSRAENDIVNLTRDCSGTILVRTETVETNLRFSGVRRALGLTATKTQEVPIYDCSSKPISGISE